MFGTVARSLFVGRRSQSYRIGTRIGWRREEKANPIVAKHFRFRCFFLPLIRRSVSNPTSKQLSLRNAMPWMASHPSSRNNHQRDRSDTTPNRYVPTFMAGGVSFHEGDRVVLIVLGMLLRVWHRSFLERTLVMGLFLYVKHRFSDACVVLLIHSLESFSVCTCCIE